MNQSFIRAKGAEAEHAKLYAEVLQSLESWKGGQKDFYVCPLCGYTTTTLPDQRCPICSEPRENFFKVS